MKWRANKKKKDGPAHSENNNELIVRLPMIEEIMQRKSSTAKGKIYDLNL